MDDIKIPMMNGNMDELNETENQNETSTTNRDNLLVD